MGSDWRLRTTPRRHGLVEPDELEEALPPVFRYFEAGTGGTGQMHGQMGKGDGARLHQPGVQPKMQT